MNLKSLLLLSILLSTSLFSATVNIIGRVQEVGQAGDSTFFPFIPIVSTSGYNSEIGSGTLIPDGSELAWDAGDTIVFSVYAPPASVFHILPLSGTTTMLSISTRWEVTNPTPLTIYSSDSIFATEEVFVELLTSTHSWVDFVSSSQSASIPGTPESTSRLPVGSTTDHLRINASAQIVQPVSFTGVRLSFVAEEDNIGFNFDGAFSITADVIPPFSTTSLPTDYTALTIVPEAQTGLLFFLSLGWLLRCRHR